MLPTPNLSRANSTVGSADAALAVKQEPGDFDGPLSPGASHLPPPYEPNQPKIPSRRLIRQVLRLRLRASKGLVAYLLSLENSDDLFRSSPYLATTSKPSGTSLKATSSAVDGQEFRKGRDVYEFLRVRGARLRGVPVDLHWLEEQSTIKSTGASTSAEEKSK